MRVLIIAALLRHCVIAHFSVSPDKLHNILVLAAKIEFFLSQWQPDVFDTDYNYAIARGSFIRSDYLTFFLNMITFTRKKSYCLCTLINAILVSQFTAFLYLVTFSNILLL